MDKNIILTRRVVERVVGLEMLKIISNGNTGAMLLGREPITGREVVKLILNDKQEVLELQRALNKFVSNEHRAPDVS